MKKKKSIKTNTRIQITTVTKLCMLCVWAFILSGCEKDFLLPKLTDEEIASNLLKKGDSDLKLLKGEWELIYFAYTANGNKISNKKTISQVSALSSTSYKIVIICDEDPKLYISEAPTGLYGPWKCLNQNLFFSISGNLIGFSRFSDNVFGVNIHVTEEGNNVLNALTNAYSFVIKGNELIIHFTGEENKNLLILKKQ